METEQQPNNPVRLERVIGIILLIAPILSVILFILNLFSKDIGDFAELKNLSSHWTGTYDTGGYTSAAPIYLGLMATAGAILLKGTDKKAI